MKNNFKYTLALTITSTPVMENAEQRSTTFQLQPLNPSYLPAISLTEIAKKLVEEARESTIEYNTAKIMWETELESIPDEVWNEAYGIINGWSRDEGKAKREAKELIPVGETEWNIKLGRKLYYDVEFLVNKYGREYCMYFVYTPDSL
jgi:PAS domain-containing protein